MDDKKSVANYQPQSSSVRRSQAKNLALQAERQFEVQECPESKDAQRYAEPDWVTDISYIIMPDGVAYLSAIRDLCGQFIVAYRTARRQDYSLVRGTVADAMQTARPEKPPLLHSDGGGQYRSYDHKKIIDRYGLTLSMSKSATPGDNAMAENFFSIYKAECIYLEKPKTIDKALALTDEFIHYYTTMSAFKATASCHSSGLSASKINMGAAAPKPPQVYPLRLFRQ